MPNLSPTGGEAANLVKWEKKVGDLVKPGEVIATIEHDKSTATFDSTELGYLAKILVPEGTTGIEIGTPIGILAENEEDIDKFKDYKAEEGAVPEGEKPPAEPAVSSAAPTPAAAPAPKAAAKPAPVGEGGRKLATPLARRLAREQGVDINAVVGSGSGGRIVAADLDGVTPSAAVGGGVSGEGFTDIPHTTMRKAIAKRLTQSKQSIPHYYLSVDINMDKILKLREELNASLQKKGGEKAVKLSVNDFVLKASALALKKVPTVNSTWMDNAIRQYKYVDISVAVSTDNGLITPIVFDADVKGLAAIGSDVRELAAKARDKKLQAHEFQGGTFSVSNLGMFGVKNFSAIINPPQAAILAVGATEKRVVPHDNPTPANPYKVSNFMSVTLSCDHRVVDGAVGAQWLQAFREYLEEPNTMLL